MYKMNNDSNRLDSRLTYILGNFFTGSSILDSKLNESGPEELVQ